MDHLIISHNLNKNLSTIYDIRSDTYQDEINCLVSPLQMATKEKSGYQSIRQYTDCRFYYPNIVVNKMSGRIYTTHLNIEALSESFCETENLISMLIRRDDSKNLITNHINRMTKKRSFMSEFKIVFNVINQPLAIYESRVHDNKQKEEVMGVEGPVQHQRGILGSAKDKISNYFGFLKQRWRQQEPVVVKDLLILSDDEFLEQRKSKEVMTHDGRIVISQHDLYRRVFAFMEETMEDYAYVVVIVTEYIRSLNDLNIPVESYIYEVIVNVLVRNGQYFKLHQLLQYHVIADSVHVACQLLYIGTKYAPAIQLAIDMFKRLNDPTKIIEVLFSKGLIMNAMKYISHLPDSVVKEMVPRFLEEAVGDEVLYDIIKSHFIAKNIKIDEKYMKHMNLVKENTHHGSESKKDGIIDVESNEETHIEVEFNKEANGDNLQDSLNMLDEDISGETSILGDSLQDINDVHHVSLSEESFRISNSERFKVDDSGKPLDSNNIPPESKGHDEELMQEPYKIGSNKVGKEESIETN